MSKALTLDDLCSPTQRAQLNQMHKAVGYGWKGHQHIPRFLPHIRTLQCKTLLDYGCGKGNMAMQMKIDAPDIDVRLFDPGHLPVSELPEPADYISCCSCLEGVEPDKVDNVLQHLFQLAIKGAYLAICIRLGKKNDLPDGRNEHLSVHPPQWWIDSLMEVGWTVMQVDIDDPKFVKLWLEK